LHHPGEQQTSGIVCQLRSKLDLLELFRLKPSFVGESPVHPSGAIFELNAPNNIIPVAKLVKIIVLQGDVHFFLRQI
jgi:hypothetical protein